MPNTKECGRCGHAITDRYLMRVADTSYHENCVACVECGRGLAHSCFTRDSKLYCRSDYDRLYVKKCLGCSEKLGPDELVMKTLDNVFHIQCFVCVVCGSRLQRGEQFVIKQGQLFCRPDYEKEVEMLQGYAQDYPCEDLISSSKAHHDGRRGPKRPRTILTTQQRRAFKASFEISPKPCRKVREGLARDTGLSVRIVQVWFQNQRAKVKKNQKKGRMDNKANSMSGSNKDTDNSSDEMDKAMILKDEQQSPHGGPPSFINDTSCSDTDTGGGSILNDPRHHQGFLPMKDDLDSNEDSFYKSVLNCATDRRYLSNDYFSPSHHHHHLHQTHQEHHLHQKPLDSSVNGAVAYGFSSHFSNAPLDSSHVATMFLQQNHPPAPSLNLNPIDRLYSMQNSYFCSEDANLAPQ